ncbi:hypothetical protein [Xanthobacter sp. ZOL 2024]
MKSIEEIQAKMFADAIFTQSEVMAGRAHGAAECLREMIATHRSTFLSLSSTAFETKDEATLARAIADIRHTADLIESVVIAIRAARKPIGQYMEAAE